MTKKKLTHDQKRKQKKEQRAKRHSPPVNPDQRMIERLQGRGFEQKIIRTPAGEPKMSAVLEEFLAPYWNIPDDAEGMRKLIIAGIVAWNTALRPEAARADQLAIIAAVPPELQTDFYAIIAELMARKQALFAEFTQPIVDYELTERDGQYHLTVMSLLPEAMAKAPAAN